MVKKTWPWCCKLSHSWQEFMILVGKVDRFTWLFGRQQLRPHWAVLMGIMLHWSNRPNQVFSLWIIQIYWDIVSRKKWCCFSDLGSKQNSINLYCAGKSKSNFSGPSEEGRRGGEGDGWGAAYFLQCPHQGAKNSTNHTSSLSNTILSKLSSVSSTTSFLLPPPPPPL